MARSKVMMARIRMEESPAQGEAGAALVWWNLRSDGSLDRSGWQKTPAD